VELATRVVVREKLLVSTDGKSFFEPCIFADQTFFKIFSFGAVQEKAAGTGLVISQRIAAKYFPSGDPLGQVMKINQSIELPVMAVIENVPFHSTLQFDIAIPYRKYAKTDEYNTEWGAWTGGATYVKLKSADCAPALQEKIHSSITKKHIWERWGDNVSLFLHRAEDWHLKSKFENGIPVGGRIDYVIAFLIVALLVLLMACINFGNIITARFTKRAKELGVRQTMGATPFVLSTQFVIEIFLFVIISSGLATIVCYISLPYFNQYIDTQLTFSLGRLSYWLASAALVVACTLTARSFSGVQFFSWRSRVSNTRTHRKSFSRVLVTFQFAVSLALVLGAIVLQQQLKFMRSNHPGCKHDQVIYFQASPAIAQHFDVIKQELLQHPNIQSVSRASGSPLNILNNVELGDDSWRGKTKEDKVVFQWLYCDEAFLEAFGFRWLQGRNFNITTDSANVILSHEAVKQMRLSKPLGEVVKIDRQGEVIGVISDFHSAPLSKHIQPVIISLRPENCNIVFLHFNGQQTHEVVDHIRRSFKKVEQEFPFEYAFLDDDFNKTYRSELMIQKIANIYISLALLIAAVGTFGLAAYLAESRMKEMSIRMVCGASPAHIVTLFVLRFAPMLAVSVFVALPVAGLLCYDLLNNYAYHISLTLPMFLIAAAVLACLCLFSLSVPLMLLLRQSAVDTLRRE